MADVGAEFGAACFSGSLGFDASAVRLVVFVRLILGSSFEMDGSTSESFDGACRLRVVSRAIAVNEVELDFGLAISTFACVDVGGSETVREGFSRSEMSMAVRREVELDSSTRSDERVVGSSGFIDVVSGLLGDDNSRRPLDCGSVLVASACPERTIGAARGVVSSNGGVPKSVGALSTWISFEARSRRS